MYRKNHDPKTGRTTCDRRGIWHHCMCGRCEIPDASGIARIGKGLEQISGDTFLMKDLPGGRKGIALSDGMGSGEEAFRDSTMV